MLGCGWRCREELGEVWESVLGCGGYEKILGEVCCSVGKVRGKCEEKCRGCGEVCWGIGKCVEGMGQCVGVWREV